MKVAISTASSYSDILKSCLKSVGVYSEILNPWGQRNGLTRIIKKTNYFHALLLQWPEALLSSEERYYLNKTIIDEIEILLYRISKYTKIIFIFHNLLPHDGFSELEKYLYERIIDSSSVILHHSYSGYIKALQLYPLLENKKNLIFRHPPYFFIHEFTSDQNLLVRLQLDLSKKYFLIIGSIAHYKNIELFFHTFSDLDLSRYGLIIAGKSYFGYFKEFEPIIRKLLNLNSDIKIIDKWLTDKEIATIVQHSDFLVCNNSNVTITSGIPHLCEAGRKILYSDYQNDYLKEISGLYTIGRDKIGEISVIKKCYNHLEKIYRDNNKYKSGLTLKSIIESDYHLKAWPELLEP